MVMHSSHIGLVEVNILKVIIMADPITVYDYRCEGHIITIVITFTSGGATATTVTIPAGYPVIDLSKAHPIISGLLLETEGDAVSGSISLLPSAEIARSNTNAPDTAGEWQIASSSTVKVIGNDKDGLLFLTYWAAGNKNL